MTADELLDLAERAWNEADGASTVAAKLLADWSGLSPADALGIIEETMPESVAGRLIGEIQ
jgi:hypothetical protein